VTTFDQLVKQVRQQLLGFAMNQESVSELAASMAAGDTSFSCDAATVTNLSRVSVMGLANGRGYEGTTAASHAAHALVTSNPAFPRSRIKEAINQTIQTLYPELVVFSSTEITKNAVVIEYELPADLSDVWYVVGQLIGPSKVWQPLPNWRYNPKASPTTFTSGKSIEVFDYVTPGQKIRIVYGKPPTALVNGSDDFAAVTGYPDRYVDMVVYGTCMRLLPALESARLQQQSIEATERAPLVPPASATRAMTMYAQLYQQRLTEERDQQFNDTPNYAYFQGS
jgi:hypothetical protein